ncbi:hypothetical protein [Corallococcus sp. EGB]|uniref:hypothetical protein n=1 Tax=Corallococcus sp. EGB TaxID=1521117 RepID=UPI001CBC5D4A|nr:hypothetical protein [Corallococcus sp. EGB]
MATNDKRPAPTQPAEDFYGRPTDPRGEAPQRSSAEEEEEEDERQPRRDQTGDDDDGDARRYDASGLRPYDPRERSPGSSLDDMPDGDGPRSDAGTNPVSDVYRYGHPDRMP